MRGVHFKAAIVLLVVGNAFAQSGGDRSLPGQYCSQSPAPVSGLSAVEARLAALERRLDQLEKRVNAVVPVDGSTIAAADRLDALDQKVQLLEHVAKVKQGPSITTGRDTFSITSPDKTFRLRIGGHLQVDGKMFPDDHTQGLTDAFNIRRARAIFEGSLGNYLDFRFMPDFGNGQSLVYDAYADLKVKPDNAVLRGGKFKTPFGLEVLQNDADRTFIENALPSDLMSNRDEGFELYGNVAHRMGYQLAVVNGAPDGTNIDSSTHNGKDLVERIFATPFAPSGPELLKGLGFGIAASSGRQDEGALLPSLRTTGGQAIFFSYGTKTVTPFADGRRVNYSPQLYYYVGPFGLMAEYADSAQKVAAGAKAATIVHSIDNHAFQVAGSWLLTGEKKSYESVVPRRGLESASNPGFGAWELAARYTELNVDPRAFAAGFADPVTSARSARAWAVGANWYLNFFAKLQFEYEQTRFEQGAPTGNRPTEKVLEERLQIAF